MDRRQRKTRAAIFMAFSALLAEKPYSRITVQQIIAAADVGRTTFYAHFQTKDDLLRALCGELFGHILDSARDSAHSHGLYSDGAAPDSVFCHLLQHLQRNDRNILGLLCCESRGLFLRYFKEGLRELIRTELALPDHPGGVPQDFLVNHIAGSFVEMVLWWLDGRQRQTPGQLDAYFRAVTAPLLADAACQTRPDAV